MIEVITHPLIVISFTVVSLLVIALIIAEKQDSEKPPKTEK
ncbi:MAG: hypothetical protein OXI88_22560 [Gammaproteobacteria bacterium]|nr:hypothetical protein [Gammaproteobacteria bacterium]MDE0283995.1 hypothetical protein [Gammaproteobacteria bacterium]MDE0514550.1 hypothetical protein [Gammaproteobacteria bacterium]